MLHPRSEGVKGVCFVRPLDIDRCCYRMIVNMQGIILRKGYRRYPSSERTEGERANICASAAQLTIPEKKSVQATRSGAPAYDARAFLQASKASAS